MELKALICPCCGQPLNKKGESCQCSFCGVHFEYRAAEKEMEFLARRLEEAKIEKLALAKRRLWDATHVKYPSQDEVVACAREVLFIDDEDPLGLVYLHSHDANPYKLNAILASLCVSEPIAREIVRWLLPSLTSGD